MFSAEYRAAEIYDRCAKQQTASTKHETKGKTTKMKMRETAGRTCFS
jgi:hypothetical protein